MPNSPLEAARVVADEAFVAALLDPRTRIAWVQGGRDHPGPGWQVQPRTIAEHMLYLITEHALEARIAGRWHRLAAGALAWVMPGVVHEFRIAPGRPSFGKVHLKVGVHARGRALRPRRAVVILPSAQELQGSVLRVAQVAEAGGRFADTRLRAALATLFADALAADGAAGRALSARQQQALSEHVARRLAERPTPAELARLLGLSSDYFTRAFRATYGIPPRAWLVRERMNAAAQRLLDSPRSVSAVAAELGFADLFLFSRQFKRTFGVGPRAYRRDPTTRR